MSGPAEAVADRTPGPWFAVTNDLIGGFAVAARDAPSSALGPADAVVADMIPRREDAEFIARCADPKTGADALAAAVRRHRDQKADDRCWVDDQALYAALGDGDLGDNGLPPREKFLANCARYYEARCRDAGWPSYQEQQAMADASTAQAVSLAKTLRDTRNLMLWMKSRCPGLDAAIEETGAALARFAGWRTGADGSPVSLHADRTPRPACGCEGTPHCPICLPGGFVLPPGPGGPT